MKNPRPSSYLKASYLNNCKTEKPLERIPQTPPRILPLTDCGRRPLWSVMIPTYNCSGFLTEAIESVLQQDLDPEEIQIEVVDDCSTDADVADLVQKVGRGRVTYFRQECNMGSLRNFETCINRARGRYIHLLHGDDRVKKGFYQELTELFDQFPHAGAAFCGWCYINSQGKLTRNFKKEAETPCILDNWLYKLTEKQRLQYVAIAVKREVYEKLGAFYGVTYGEDWEMWARIARHYPTAYTPEVLAEYREHGDGSISKNSFLSGKNIKDIAWVIDTITQYLPKEDQRRINRQAKKHYVHWALKYATKLWKATRNRSAVFNQLRQIIRVYLDTRLAISISRLLAHMYLDPVRVKMKKVRDKQNSSPVKT